MNIINKINLSQDKFIIQSDNSSLKLNYTLEKDKCIVDISSLNLFEATKIAILTSTYCFINNFEKKLCWIVKDEQTRKAISLLRLRNMEQKIKSPKIKEMVSA